MSDLEFTQTTEATTGSSAGAEIKLSPEKEAEYERIMRNLQESTSGDIIRKVLSDGEVVRAYWGEYSRAQVPSRVPKSHEVLTSSRICHYWTAYVV